MKAKKIFLLCMMLICMMNVSSVFAVSAEYYDFSEQLSAEEAKKTVTRGEFSHYLSNLLKQKGILINSEGETMFADVANSHQNYDDIMHLKTLLIVNGVGNSNFRPDDNITYEEVSAMISRIFLPDSDINMEYGAYPTGYVKYALKMGLLKDVTAIVADDITLGDVYIIMDNLENSIKIYNLIEKLGCDAYNGEVYIDYYPKSWQGFEEKPLATTNGYFRILPSKLLYSYDRENWYTLYEDTNEGRKYNNLPQNIDGARYAWEYSCFVNAPFDANQHYYSYNNKEWIQGIPDSSEFSEEVELERDKFILGIRKETILYDSESELYFSWQPYEEKTYYSQRYETNLQELKYNMIWVSKDTVKWVGVRIPDDMLFFTSAGINNRADALIIDGAVRFTDEEKAFLDGEEEIATDLGLGYDKPWFKTEKYILRFSELNKIFE